MHISWLGNTAIKLQTKPFDKDVVVVIDPYRPAVGEFPRSLMPDIGLYTRGENGSITLSGKPFVLSNPGECETKGVLITAVQGHEPNQVMLRLDAEQLSLGHVGFTNKQLTDKQLEVLNGVDILFVPVGNGESYDAEAAAKVVNAIEPRVVIPMAFKCDNDPKAKSVDEFLKEMGVASGPVEKKVIIKKKDLPQEDTQVIVLGKE
jgi:L-ascorbate metabolism protein UlaG (beta-lactamase superfamily)